MSRTHASPSTPDAASATDGAGRAAEGDPGPGSALDPIRVEQGPAHVLDRLDQLARRGKLPGFRKLDDRSFAVDAFGNPFDYEVRASIETRDGGATVRCSLRRKAVMPVVAALVLVLTVEPGRYFMDQLIPGEWGWINTMWWYYPLTILPLPWVWRALAKRSHAAALEHAREQVEKISTALTTEASTPHAPASLPDRAAPPGLDHSGEPLERS